MKAWGCSRGAVAAPGPSMVMRMVFSGRTPSLEKSSSSRLHVILIGIAETEMALKRASDGGAKKCR